HIDRNREADPFVAAAGAGNGCVDANYFAAKIKERPAAVAGIDGGIGLQKVLVLHAVVGQLQVAAAFGADNAVADRGRRAEVAAHGEDKIADFQAARIAEARGNQAVGRDLHDRDVGGPVGPDVCRVQDAAIGQLDVDAGQRGIADHVPVGDD